MLSVVRDLCSSCGSCLSGTSRGSSSCSVSCVVPRATHTDVIMAFPLPCSPDLRLSEADKVIDSQEKSSQYIQISSLQIYLPLAFRTSAELLKKQVVRIAIPCWITQNDSSIRLWNTTRAAWLFQRGHVFFFPPLWGRKLRWGLAVWQAWDWLSKPDWPPTGSRLASGSSSPSCLFKDFK